MNMYFVSSICEGLMCLCVCPYVFEGRGKEWGSGQVQGKGENSEGECGEECVVQNQPQQAKKNNYTTKNHAKGKIIFSRVRFKIFGTGCHRLYKHFMDPKFVVCT